MEMNGYPGCRSLMNRFRIWMNRTRLRLTEILSSRMSARRPSI